MATDKKRGPSTGDAKSLWNFTSAPGWTPEETRILELCLMKYGSGQWAAVLNTGLLPGKLTGQLYNQTQRLLGQQSLAVFSGLYVDVERVRRDNAARRNVTRKGGVIINTGGTVLPKDKEKKRADVIEQYGLTKAQEAKVDEELEKIRRKVLHQREGSMATTFSHRKNVSSLYQDVTQMKRAEKLSALRELRDEVVQLYRLCQPPVGIRQPHPCRKREISTLCEEPWCKRPRKGNRKKIEVEEEEVEADPGAVEKIIEMGYTRRHAVDALLENNNQIEAAIQWLVLNCR